MLCAWPKITISVLQNKALYSLAYSEKHDNEEDCLDGEQPNDGKVCSFSSEALGINCTKNNNYGYDHSMPCVLLKVNRVRCLTIHLEIYLIFLNKTINVNNLWRPDQFIEHCVCVIEIDTNGLFCRSTTGSQWHLLMNQWMIRITNVLRKHKPRLELLAQMARVWVKITLELAAKERYV